MTKTVDFYFTVLSSYSYLAMPRVAALRERSGAEFVFRPVDIMQVFAAAGTTPPAKQSDARKAYRKADLVRVAKARGMPINPMPAHWPAPQDLASGLILAAAKAGADPLPVTQAILTAVWAEERNIADANTLVSIAKGVGLDGKEMVSLAAAEDVQAQFAVNTTMAIKRGVFGAPSFALNGDLFWGQDRLDYLEAALA